MSMLYTTKRTMNTDEKILKALEDLKADVTVIKDVQQKQGKDIVALKIGQGQIELKTEAIHEYQKKAQAEIMEHLFESNEMSGRAQKELAKRVERIEKHLGLPPLK